MATEKMMVAITHSTLHHLLSYGVDWVAASLNLHFQRKKKEPCYHSFFLVQTSTLVIVPTQLISDSAGISKL